MKISVVTGAIVGPFVIALAAFAFPHLLHRALASRNGTLHRFNVADASFLSEPLALEKARAALALDGYSETAWQPCRDGRTVAPDGRRDDFLSRNTINPKEGSVVFTNLPGAQVFVRLELDGTNLLCQRVYLK